MMSVRFQLTTCLIAAGVGCVVGIFRLDEKESLQGEVPKFNGHLAEVLFEHDTKGKVVSKASMTTTNVSYVDGNMVGNAIWHSSWGGYCNNDPTSLAAAEEACTNNP